MNAEACLSRRLVVAAALVLGACGGDSTGGKPTPPPPTPPENVAQVLTINNDTMVVGPAGSVVEDTFGVVVRDAAGNPVANRQVTWTVTEGGGTIQSPTTTDAKGVARTQWVLGPGPGAFQRATATIAGQTVRFTAAVATEIKRLGPPLDPDRAPPGVTLNIAVWVAPGLEGLPIRWTVTSGGGTVTPEVGRIKSYPNNPAGYPTELASAQWTLGTGVGPQTLTASSGSVSLTFKARTIATATRTPVVTAPGTVLDATADRVAWSDLGQIKVRTLATGADVPVGPGGSAHLFTGGVLVWNYWGDVLELRGGTLTSLAAQQGGVVAKGDWAVWQSPEGGVVRRNLAAGTSVVLPEGTCPCDVAQDGSVAYLSGSSLLLYQNGVASVRSSAPADSVHSVYTDGVNVGYVALSTATHLVSAYLAFPSGDERLVTGDGPYRWPRLALAGGWTVWGHTRLYRRSPTGETVLIAGPPAGHVPAPETGELPYLLYLQGISPAGAVVYETEGVYWDWSWDKFKVYLDTPAGGPSLIGPYGPSAAWRGDRWMLVDDRSVSEVRP